MRVLLADDHGIVRRGLRSLLETEPGLTVAAEAADGLEALRLCEEHRPDLLIVDIGMPKLNGIDVAEPGRYVIQAALHQPEGDIVSAPAALRIAPPRTFEEEVLAQDVFTDAVGRVMAFDGSNVLKGANDTLREVVDKLGDRRVARHARIPLALAVLVRVFLEQFPLAVTDQCRLGNFQPHSQDFARQRDAFPAQIQQMSQMLKGSRR